MCVYERCRFERSFREREREKYRENSLYYIDGVSSLQHIKESFKISFTAQIDGSS